MISVSDANPPHIPSTSSGIISQATDAASITADEWIIDTESMTLRRDLQLQVLAVIRRPSSECFALSIQGVLTPAVLVPIIWRGIKTIGRPSRVTITESTCSAMPVGLDDLLERFQIPVHSSDASLHWEKRYFDALSQHLHERCGDLPRHFALPAIRRAGELWRHSYNRHLHAPKRTSRPPVKPVHIEASGATQNKQNTSTSRILTIEFCPPGKLRMLKVVTRSGNRWRVKYWSVKLGRVVEAELNEAPVFCELDCDPRVRTFREQPCRITYLLKGEKHEHFPDAIVSYFSGPEELCEIKLAKDAKTSEVKDRTALMCAELPIWGYEYTLRIAEESARQPAKRNREEIVSYADRPVSIVERELIVRECTRLNGVTWGTACNGDYGRSGPYMLARLFIDGLLTFDMNTRLDPNTRFVLRDGG